MKILHLLSSGGYYGKEAVVIALCSALERLGHGSEIGAFLNSQNPNEEVMIRGQQQGIQARRFACNGRLDVRAVSQIREHILSQRIDLIHSHDYKADIYGYLAGRWTGRPTIATCHLWFSTTLSDRIYAKIDQLCLRHFDGVVAVASHIERTLQQAGVSSRKIAVIPNGIDFTSFLEVRRSDFGRSGNGPVIGIVGRLTRQKGHSLLFAAAPGILQKFPDTKFLIIGDGPDREKLEAVAAETGIADSVHFAGFRSDMPTVYEGLDLLVMPSLDEGLPITLLEALAAGCPVVASSVGAVPDVIEHGRNGLLIPPGDSASVEHSILLLLSDSNLRKRVAENARRSVGKFSADEMARNYLQFYANSGCLPHQSSGIEGFEHSAAQKD